MIILVNTSALKTTTPLEWTPASSYVSSSRRLVALLSPQMQADLPEVQHPNAVNIQEAIKGAEAKPRLRCLTLIIVGLLVLLHLRQLTRHVGRNLQC